MNITHKLPAPVSEFLHTNFRESCLFDDLREEKDAHGNRVFVTWINDGKNLHQMIFTEQGVLCKHEITAAYPDDLYENIDSEDEYYEDDF